MITAQRVVQAAWLIAAAPIVFSVLRRGDLLSSAMWFGGWIVLAVGTTLLWRGARSGLLLSAAVAAVVATVTVPWAVYNFWAFATRHPRYVDSPATIFVVAVTSAISALPALAVLLFSAANRSRFIASGV